MLIIGDLATMGILEMPLCDQHAGEVTRHPEGIIWHEGSGRTWHVDEYMISDL
jgi:hypothetical protein